jgi:hypothetical protein
MTFTQHELQVLQAALTAYLGKARPTPNRAVANRLRNEFRAAIFAKPIAEGVKDGKALILSQKDYA